MASAEDFAKWIVQNPDKRGTPDFDTVAQAFQAAREAETAQPQAEPQQTAPRSLLDRIKGLGETGLTLATGATTGTFGALGGVAKTIGQNVLYGASDGLEKNVVTGMQAGTYLPKTSALSLTLAE